MPGQVVRRSPTFVLEEVAHASPAGEHELRDVLHDLGLVFRGKGGEPLGKTLQLFSTGELHGYSRRRTTLPCRESRMRYLQGLASGTAGMLQQVLT